MKKNAGFFSLMLVGLFLLTTACNNPSASNSQPPIATEKDPFVDTSSREILPNGITIEIDKATELREDRSNLAQFKRDLNKRVAKIIIPEALFNSDLEVYRTLKPEAVNPRYEVVSKTSAIFENGQYIMIDKISPWDRNYLPQKISYKVYIKDSFIGMTQTELVPDLLISPQTGGTHLSQLNISSGEFRFGVIFMESGSVLYTQGSSVDFVAHRFYADSAKIETFSEQEASTPQANGQQGLSGGLLQIRAKSAAGDLEVHLRGTRGGKGYDFLSEPAALTTPGPKGRRAESERKEKCSRGRSDADYCFEYFNCRVPPGDGLPGPIGTAGFEGGPGMPGGATGAAVIQIESDLGPFNVNLLHYPGKGGLGGQGGPGGRGGPGGDPGDLDSQGGCKVAAKRGPEGPVGPIGPQGPEGIEGQVQSSTVIIAGKKIK